MPSPVLQFKRGSYSNIGIASFKAGEPGFTTDKYDFYIGLDGTSNNQKFFGSARYWLRENATNAAQLKLVDKDGTNYIGIAASDTLSGIATYRLPDTTDGVSGDFLKLSDKTNGVYSLEWASIPSGSFTLAGDTGTDVFTTGETLTFTGGTNLNSAITDNVVTFNLDDNISISGIATVGSLICNDGSTFNGNVQINNNLNVNGNITLGGTSIYHASEQVLIRDKDIILGITTDISLYPDNSTDNTANHGGIAIASTEGSPLISLQAVGINSLPDTYKQIMWMKSGTWTGLSTDAWMFNYAVGIGSTQIPSGIRLAVGGVQISDTTISAEVGNFTTLTGTISTATRATTIDTVTAGDSAGQYHLTFVNSHNGSATPETLYTDDGIYYNPGTNTFTTQHASFTGNVTVQGTLTGTATTATTVTTTGTSDNATYYVTFVDTSGGQVGETLRVGSALSLNASTGNVKASGDLIAGSGYLASSNGTRAMYMYDTSGDVSFQGKVVANNIRSSSNASNTLTLNDLDATFARNLTVTGIATVGTSLSTPTVKTSNINAADGTSAITITSSTGAVGVSSDLTITGNLYVNGNTTQVNTATLTVEDALVELGMIDGSAPVSDLNKDLGLLFNYYTTSAKKAAVFWDDSAQRIVFADDVTEAGGVLTVASNAYASIEIEALWVNDCAGQSQVINCSGSTRTLENITIDCGTF